MLDFVDTPKNQVVLTPLGHEVVEHDINGRREIFRKQVAQHGTMKFVQQILRESPTHTLPADVVQEELVIRLPTQDLESLFDVLVRWGRYAGLFEYDPETETFSLEEKA
jgi:NitT/TauT family transport system ATP-binding protein